MPYIQSIAVFLIVVLNLTGYLEIGDLSPKGPNLYLQIVLMVSFFFGLWGLFVFFDITHRFDLLEDFQYRKKAALLKLIVILVNIQVLLITVFMSQVFDRCVYFQGFVIDALAHYEIIACIEPNISRTAMGSVIKSICSLLESFLLGTAAFRLYIIDDTHL